MPEAFRCSASAGAARAVLFKVAEEEEAIQKPVPLQLLKIPTTRSRLVREVLPRPAEVVRQKPWMLAPLEAMVESLKRAVMVLPVGLVALAEVLVDGPMVPVDQTAVMVDQQILVPEEPVKGRLRASLAKLTALYMLVVAVVDVVVLIVIQQILAELVALVEVEKAILTVELVLMALQTQAVEQVVQEVVVAALPKAAPVSSLSVA